MNGLYLLIGIASIISVLVTFFLGRLVKNYAIIKYIPTIVAALTGIGFYIKSRYFSTNEGFEGLGYIILTLVAGIVFVLSLITAILMDFVGRKKG